ncbi:hypothetical protein QYF36_018599 [Acer negundo]|nr:hypothetical protein QYF36_018599 [Acer negundo]
MLNIKDCCRDSKCVFVSKQESGIPPDVESLKFNVDGAARGSPKAAGSGGVSRDYNRKVLCSFSSFAGHQCAKYVEILAILRACQLCASQPSLSWKNIIIISDLSDVVSWVNDARLGKLCYLNYILEIRQWISTMGNVSVIFNSRVSNFFADSLAKRVVEYQVNTLVWSLG